MTTRSWANFGFHLHCYAFRLFLMSLFVLLNYLKMTLHNKPKLEQSVFSSYFVQFTPCQWPPVSNSPQELCAWLTCSHPPGCFLTAKNQLALQRWLDELYERTSAEPSTPVRYTSWSFSRVPVFSMQGVCLVAALGTQSVFWSLQELFLASTREHQRRQILDNNRWVVRHW